MTKIGLKSRRGGGLTTAHSTGGYLSAEFLTGPHLAPLVGLKDRFDIAFGNDPDADRHGIVTPGGGLMNPNHVLAAAISYLFIHRSNWRPNAAVGKTVVSSSVIDRVAAKVGRALVEVPVGLKWFVPGLLD